MTDEISPASPAEPNWVGQRFSRQVTLTRAEIATFATLCGDLNPLHHDEDYARRSRFGSIIACGPQTTALMMAMTATYFSQTHGILGLEFSFRFRKAVKADDTIDMEWEIVEAEQKASLGGTLVSLRGEATNQHGQAVLTGTGKLLVTEE